MNVKYVGALKDHSGYGEANRHDVASLLTAGIKVTAKIPVYTTDTADYGRLGNIINAVEDKNLKYDIVILHTTPNVYPLYMEEGKYHIARAFWETDKLPPEFAKGLELCNEIWTGSKYNARAIRKSGVTKPIYIIPEAIDTEFLDYKPFKAIDDKVFSFYSVFEWTDRKNPEALLSAYWQEFENDENVVLVLKTYLDNFTKKKKEEIDFYLKKIKSRVSLRKYQPVLMYRHLMDRNQVYRFHKTFDCFVSAHRGEGWGIPQMEAMLMGKPVISTNCGGIHEYLTDRENAFLIPYTLIPLTGNNRNKQWYLSDQKWADVDIDELRKAMRFVYENRERSNKIAEKGKDVVIKNFSLDVIGNKMKERLLKINRRIK